ncbi:MAG TPA: RHS repeat-associated core domain-containing protein, partial [Elusimicrobiota bacterium]|nr:RHS repeat-associated core domain-containing protein [Elusimicrobiota bacterium]
GGTTYQYVYDNQDILAIVDQNDNLVALFTHGPGIDEPLEIRQGASGPEYFLHADGLGSIVAVTDGTGNVVERIQYEAYGQPVFLDERGSSPAVESQSFTGSPYAFTGREWDQESGMYFYRQRYSDTLTGRYLQQDPLSLRTGANAYAYVEDNPVNFVDPNGLIFLVYLPGTNDLFTFSRQWPLFHNFEVHNNIVPGHQGLTPGIYQIAMPVPTTANEFGPWYIPIHDLNGQNTHVGIHGGGSAFGNRAFLPYQGWRPTFGCFRAQNYDLHNLVQVIDHDWRRNNYFILLPQL